MSRPPTYNDKLLTIMCSQHPTFRDVLTLFTDNYHCDHFILLRLPEVVDYYYLMCGNFSHPIDHKFSAEFVPGAANSQIEHNPPVEVNGIQNISSMRRIDINDKLILVLINPGEPPEDDQIIPFTVKALQSLYSTVEVDVPYTIQSVNEMTDEQLQSIAQRSFSVINYHPAELFQNLFAMFVRSQISTKAGINNEDLLRFFVILRNHYNDVPYHNWFHAIDVTQFAFSVIQTVNMHSYLTDCEVFGLLLSAICHDTDHNGMNNTFHRNAHTIFAHLAPNLPPLEHHHSCITMDLARGILNQIADPDERSHLCHFIIDLIMATDMEQHKVFLENFKQIQEGFRQNDESHRLLLAQIVLKAADLSNTVRDFNEAMRMSQKLTEETHRQGDEEKRLGLKVSPMCDRDDKTPLCFGQVGFYTFVVRQLMKELHDFFPALSDNERQFVENLETWKRMKEEIEQQQ